MGGQPPVYRPGKNENIMSQTNHGKSNHLKGQTSPYLLQHLYNPVDWYPWGDEALEKAKRENKPLLVSIGYSACHWCHVMEKESFEDPEVAEIMNRYFVCIKVDREERPDIDHIYMNSVQLLSGRGGWPLNCFALPGGRPFWGGTYFPKEQWKSILERVHELFEKQFDDLEDQAEKITMGLSQSSFIKPKEEKSAFGREEAKRMTENLLEYIDPVEGGIKGAPKFPIPNNFEFLLHAYHHNRNQKILDMVLLTLKKMAMGGIYDQIGGGFARYSTDKYWKVPHFEKMLYDNAQLTSLYASAYKVNPEPLFKEVVSETIAFVERELTAPEGTFYAALDADSEGEEGKYYVWEEKEFESVMGDQAPLMKEYYNLGGKGSWENGRNILLRNETDESFASAHEMTVDELKALVFKAKKELLNARSKRVKPGLDDKVLVSWNALMIKSLCDAYTAFEQPDYLKKALAAAEFICAHAMKPNGELFRLINKNKPSIQAFLEDYALLADALISLYQVSADSEWLHKAKSLITYTLDHFSKPETNMLSFSSKQGEELAAPFYEFHDNVIPSSNSVMACNLFALANYFENPEWGQRSSDMLRDIKGHLEKFSSSFSNWGRLLLQHVYPFYTVAITGPQAETIARDFFPFYLPEKIMAPAKDQDSSIPVLQQRFQKGETRIYVCSMGSCQLPVKTAEEALKQMQA